MSNYHIWTVGCQMNKADSDVLSMQLEELGYLPVDDAGQADVVVVNSCSVRQSAENRVQGKLGTLKSLKRRRPEVLVALVGCMVGPNADNLRSRFPHVDVFCRPQQFEPLIEKARDHRTVIAQNDPEGIDSLRALPWKKGAVTAFVPIQHGCDKFCTYCIVPYRRGREISREIAAIVDDVTQLTNKGVREVTLLGQTVDSYGHDWKDRDTDLADLLEAIHDIPKLQRIRFLTSYPPDMTDRIIDAVAQLPKVCEHFNVPVQSGHDDVLKSMRRGYRVSEYRELIYRIRDRVPGVTLATDVIVGYPGETEEQFQATYDLLHELRFDTVHVAAYSVRPGTIASKWDDNVPLEEKKRRLHAVEQLQETIATELNARLLGTRQTVLVEEVRGEKWMGRTRGNKLVFFEDDADLRGEEVSVQIVATSPWSLQAEPAEAAVLV
jgi:tRNA-2-methylthio-N6-dimethylallyladenosine synthase